jgi:NADH dehydrogenase
MNAVTGALSFTGRAIAEELLRRGERVVSLSRRDDPDDPLRPRIDLKPLRFDDSLVASLQGVHTLYNTFWIRFERGRMTFDDAVRRTIALFEAARSAGVARVVHLSVSGADAADDLPYFRGKHRIEQWLGQSDLDWAIVRPTLVFGSSDILVNNIAWILRRLPLFLVPRPVGCLVQPVSVRDTARIAIDAEPRVVQDAAGPEVHEFGHFVRSIASAIGSRARIASAPRPVALAFVRVGNAAVRDVVVTRDELEGLSRSLLTSSMPPKGADRFSEWLRDNAGALGRRYESELRRNWRGQE